MILLSVTFNTWIVSDANSQFSLIILLDTISLAGYLFFFSGLTHSFIIPRDFNFSLDVVALCAVQTLSHEDWILTVYNWKNFLKGIKDSGVCCPNLYGIFELNSGLHGPVFFSLWCICLPTQIFFTLSSVDFTLNERHDFCRILFALLTQNIHYFFLNLTNGNELEIFSRTETFFKFRIQINLQNPACLGY